MGKILKNGQYGLINGHLFYEVNFDNCTNKTNLKEYEIERKLFGSTDVKFVSKGEVEINGKLFEKFFDTIHFYGEYYTIDFAVQIVSGILYVTEVDYGE